jgi:DNA polymerase I
MQEKKLFLIDAHALIYRAYFAFIKNPRLNSKGMNTSAIFGFLNSLMEVLEKEKPSHMAVAFDAHGDTVRHEYFDAYKAQREKQPEDISISIPLIKQILKAMHIPVYEMQGYEADDLMGTMAKQAARMGFDVYLFTPDKDFAQLVDEHVFLFKPARMGKFAELWDIEKVKTEFGIERVDQVIDIQGLMGDAVDNIPGIPGIGPKTAQKLIAQYDTVENLLKNTHALEGRIKELVETYKEQALLSKKLARILLDAPIELKEEETRIREFDTQGLEAIFAELEFANLGKRILGKDIDTHAAENLSPEQVVLFEKQIEKMDYSRFDPQHKEYKEIIDVAELEKSIREIEKSGEIALHLNTNMPDPHDCMIKGIAISYAHNKAFYHKFPRDDQEQKEQLQIFRTVLENPEIAKCGYDLKKDIITLNTYGIDLKGVFFDNMIMHYLIDPESQHDPELLSKNYLNYQPMLLTDGSFSDFYCEKADINLQIKQLLNNEIRNTEGYEGLYRAIEAPMIRVLADMEMAGIHISKDVLQDYSLELKKEIGILEKDIHKISGVSFNINSPQQLGHVLFNIMKMDPQAKKTKKGKQYSTGEEVLQKLRGRHEIIDLVLEYRGLQKLISTYVDPLPELIRKDSGRIHSTFNQAVTATGRLSSTNPNLQNIPIRTEKGRFIRKAFTASSENYKILSADYSQIELRIVAHVSEDKGLLDAFSREEDIHNSTAARIYGVPIEDVSPEMRRKAKVVNFGIIYGISGWGLAQRLQITRKEGTEIIDAYFKQYPGVKKFMNDTISFAREHAFVKTLSGRRRFLPDIDSRNATIRSFAERNAINAPIQGTAADLIKIAMVRINESIKQNNYQSRMLLQVHDELLFEVHQEEIEAMKKLIKDTMENAMHLKVPLRVEMGTGQNWLEAH